MKKKRGKSRASPPKKKKFFLFNGRIAPIVLTFVFLALVIMLPFFTTGNAVNATVSITGNANALENEVTGNWLNAVNWLGLPEPLTWRDLIVFIITLAIIFVILFDILSLVSLFDQWVSGVIAGGMTIILSLIGWIRVVTVWLITIGGTIGILAGFLEIIIAIVIFVGFTLANPKLAAWGAARKAMKMKIKGIKGGAQARTAITELRKIGEELYERKPK